MNDASTLQPRVVHSSWGRLRVHLPDPSGQIVLALRSFPGVTLAKASALTENILILFDPRQTSEQAILADLQTLCLTAPVAAPLPPPLDELGTGNSVVYVTGMHRRVYHVLGWSSVGLGSVGVVLPGVPTVPFLVLASYFFIRSSPRAHDWLLRSQWFGPMLRDWETHHGVKRSVKYTAVSLMAVGLTITWLLALPAALTAAILALEAVGLVIVLRLPVVADEEGDVVLATVVKAGPGAV